MHFMFISFSDFDIYQNFSMVWVYFIYKLILATVYGHVI